MHIPEAQRSNTLIEPIIKSRPKVGMIVLSTDLTCEHDFHYLRHKRQIEFDVFVNRIHFQNPITSKSLSDMLFELPSAAAQILPDTTLDALVFNCTAASALLGEARIKQAIDLPNTPIITTAAASLQSIQSAGYTHIDLLCPYSQSVSYQLAEYFSQQGLTITSLTYLDIDDDRDIACVSPASIVQAAKGAVTTAGQALFISCTALQVVGALDALQNHIKKPIFSSNLCTFTQVVEQLNKATHRHV
ncbi:aspartate racemase/maleate isomerase family protein [Ostreibacterium oceani]|uniref:Maleate isomerase n=1 Tax=Ostreibacterium oceani TaxID=2654998 RepID=A0A6N7ETY4_9GAMM|nr:hypothetical protein [Ostreibacterium oceani]MPV86011.1 hypothetical protein [Ostreibacterium oceani]